MWRTWRLGVRQDPLPPCVQALPSWMLFCRWLTMAARMVERLMTWAHWARPRVKSSFQQARTRLVLQSCLGAQRHGSGGCGHTEPRQPHWSQGHSPVTCTSALAKTPPAVTCSFVVGPRTESRAALPLGSTPPVPFLFYSEAGPRCLRLASNLRPTRLSCPSCSDHERTPQRPARDFL